MRQRGTLTIRREDHLEDALGAIFFEPAEGNESSILQRLRDYLGTHITLIRAEIGSKQMTVEVAAQCFGEESARLAAEADKLWSAGGRRAALAMSRDAVELDVLSQRAAATLGLFLLDSDAPGEALAALRRARELGPESAEVLRHLARVCLKLERKSSAVAYLRAAVAIAPRDFPALRMLDQLGYRKPRAEQGEGGVAAEPAPSSRNRKRRS
ncbi:MAG TPA: tetratricopeptide repeat protein [Candidatus Binataceae bacterium]|nr:tetratricopeptide repeat protein [Candidatus Binataceae bacterium]